MGDLFLVQGTQGTLRGSETSLSWKYFKPSDVKPLVLDTRPLRNDKGEPIYCRENLNFYEEKWNIDGKIENPHTWDADQQGFGYYKALYSNFVNNEDFPVKHEHLMLQMKVMGAAHAQNKKLFL